jgi:hypothetical protein
LKNTWKEEIVAFYEVLQSYLPEGLRKLVNNLASTFHRQSQRLKLETLKYEALVQLIPPPSSHALCIYRVQTLCKEYASLKLIAAAIKMS